MNLNKDAIRLLDRLYKELYLDEQVLHHGTGNKYDKFNNIASYLNKLESVHNKISDSNKHIEYLKKCYYDKYVIKEEDIPESYYKNQEQMALDRGFGHINITDEQRKKLQNEVIENQKRSLDTWIDYFLNDDSKVYPFWTKYWAFQGMLTLGYFDKEKGKFYKRTKGTIYPFFDLNREALSMSIDLLIKSLNKEKIEDKDLENLIKSGSFQKIYTYILTKVLNDNKNIAKRNIGKWVKYDQGSDHMPLVKSLKGYNTGWCTAGESIAREQLEIGDFYVYYTLDDNDEYKVPRIAIRMEEDSIGEIRGIAENQNIEPDMEKVVEEKLKEFPDRELYYKKVNDMELLKVIYNKFQNNKELSKDDLIFLYELNNKIDGFGYANDPRINEILLPRNKKKDLAYILDCKEEQIILTDREFNDDENIIYYEGNINRPELVEANGIAFPKYIGKDLMLKNAKKIVNVKFPSHIFKDFHLPFVKLIENSNLPEYVGGSMHMTDIENLKDLVFPKIVGEFLFLNNVKTAVNVVLPECVNEVLFLQGLEYAENLVLPQRVGCNVCFLNLESPEGLIFPEKLTYNVYLKELDITPENVDKYRSKQKKYIK